MLVFLRNPRSRLPWSRTRWIRPIRNLVKRRKPHSNLQSWSSRAYSLHNFPQESRALFEASAVFPFPRMRAEKFVPQITMAMLNVYKIEAEIVRYARGAMKLLNDFFDFCICEQRIVRRQIQAAVQNRMTV